MGNLADELDQLDDEDFEEEVSEAMVNGQAEDNKQPSPIDGARDSGIDVSYSSKRSSPRSPRIKNFSKPFCPIEKPPDEKEEEPQEDELSPELEDAMNSIARMTSYTSTSEDPLIPRIIGLLQDLGNQSILEASIQRLNTSISSMTSHMIVQTKTIQIFSTSLYSPFAFSAYIDPELVNETTPLVDALLKELPLPDPVVLQGLQKLDRETSNVIHTLSQLTDTLQMGKQATNTASRHLRTTQTMVAELRREREGSEIAREELSRSDWNDRIRDRWCAGECRDVMAGFEQRCNDLRQTLVEAHA